MKTIMYKGKEVDKESFLAGIMISITSINDLVNANPRNVVLPQLELHLRHLHEDIVEGKY